MTVAVIPSPNMLLTSKEGSDWLARELAHAACGHRTISAKSQRGQRGSIRQPGTIRPWTVPAGSGGHGGGRADPVKV
jgi:hypothetical protein